MSQSAPGKDSRKQYYFNMALAAVAGQAGCLTLVIVLAAVFLGLWLDNRFATKPVITLTLVFGSLPIALIIMFVVVRGAIKRIKLQSPGAQDRSKNHCLEENDLGRG